MREELEVWSRKPEKRSFVDKCLHKLSEGAVPKVPQQSTIYSPSLELNAGHLLSCDYHDSDEDAAGGNLRHD